MTAMHCFKCNGTKTFYQSSTLTPFGILDTMHCQTCDSMFELDWIIEHGLIQVDIEEIYSRRGGIKPKRALRMSYAWSIDDDDDPPDEDTRKQWVNEEIKNPVSAKKPGSREGT